jgi:hypothetical protein
MPKYKEYNTNVLPPQDTAFNLSDLDALSTGVDDALDMNISGDLTPLTSLDLASLTNLDLTPSTSVDLTSFASTMALPDSFDCNLLDIDAFNGFGDSLDFTQAVLPVTPEPTANNVSTIDPGSLSNSVMGGKPWTFPTQGYDVLALKTPENTSNVPKRASENAPYKRVSNFSAVQKEGNRIAAQKFRQRQKEKHADLITKVDGLGEKNESLKTDIIKLEAQRDVLKMAVIEMASRNGFFKNINHHTETGVNELPGNSFEL